MKAAGELYLMRIWRDLRGRFDTVRTNGGNAEQLTLLLAELQEPDQAADRASRTATQEEP